VGFSTDYEGRLNLNRAKSIFRSRLILLLAVLAVFAVTLAGPVQPAAMAVCPDSANVYYYSDATYSTVVGHCWHSCCQLWTCTGVLTDYYTVRTRSCSVQ